MKTDFDMPFNLIDIESDNEHFIFRCLRLEDSGYGLNGTFGIVYSGNSLDCCYECDITIGNIYEFYLSLDTAYDLIGKNCKAVMQNYGNTLKRTYLAFEFDKKGRCNVYGNFKNSDNFYRSGIYFEFAAYLSDITDTIRRMETFFRELEKIQGDRNFY